MIGLYTMKSSWYVIAHMLPLSGYHAGVLAFLDNGASVIHLQHVPDMIQL